jgi:Isochorismatase family
MSNALLVVDVQQGMFAMAQPLYRGDEILSHIAVLLKRARSSGCPVIHIRHAGRAGGPLEKGSAGWFHHPRVIPLTGERIIDKEQSSAFHHTSLNEQLSEAGVEAACVVRCADRDVRRIDLPRRSRSRLRRHDRCGHTYNLRHDGHHRLANHRASQSDMGAELCRAVDLRQGTPLRRSRLGRERKC